MFLTWLIFSKIKLDLYCPINLITPGTSLVWPPIRRLSCSRGIIRKPVRSRLRAPAKIKFKGRRLQRKSSWVQERGLGVQIRLTSRFQRVRGESRSGSRSHRCQLPKIGICLHRDGKSILEIPGIMRRNRCRHKTRRIQGFWMGLSRTIRDRRAQVEILTKQHELLGRDRKEAKSRRCLIQEKTKRLIRSKTTSKTRSLTMQTSTLISPTPGTTHRNKSSKTSYSTKAWT